MLTDFSKAMVLIMAILKNFYIRMVRCSYNNHVTKFSTTTSLDHNQICILIGRKTFTKFVAKLISKHKYESLIKKLVVYVGRVIINYVAIIKSMRTSAKLRVII